jgi:hypothetical protein
MTSLSLRLLEKRIQLGADGSLEPLANGRRTEKLKVTVVEDRHVELKATCECESKYRS